MFSSLPDPQRSTAAHAVDLSHVGMENIALPLLIDNRCIHGFASVSVDLPATQKRRGIHMSRLYQHLNEFCDEALTPRHLSQMMQTLLASQPGSHLIHFSFEGHLYLARPAMLTEHFGWKAYPIRITTEAPQTKIRLQVEVPYSSVCPCSTELSREILLEKWQFDFHHRHDGVSSNEVYAWLKENALMAIPHNQRSVAQVEVVLSPDATEFGIKPLLDLIEQTLGTPVQTAVKRPDEQAFAIANAQHLQFCEDAARKLIQALQRYEHGQVKVIHQESLHAHDAVATGHW